MNKIQIIDLNSLKTLTDKDKFIFVNFDYKYALKISYFYEEITKKERIELIHLFKQLTNIEIRVDDMLGKLHIILLKLLRDAKKDYIVISTIGFNIKSFQFLIDNFNKIFKNSNYLNNKHIIIVECNFNDENSYKEIDKYFTF